MAASPYEGRVEVVSDALIVNKDGKVLLVKSPKWGDVYLIPGGHAEYGEALLDAAKREGEEETGLKLKPLYCVNVGELIFDPSFHRKAHFIFIHVVCEALTTELKTDPHEVREYVWVKPREALELNLAHGIAETIRNYLANVRIDIPSMSF